MFFGSVVSLGMGLNTEGFDMLRNVLLRTGFWCHVEYEVILYCFSEVRLLHKTFTQSRSLFTWLLWHQIFCLNSKKTVLDHVICMTIAHKLFL